MGRKGRRERMGKGKERKGEGEKEGRRERGKERRGRREGEGEGGEGSLGWGGGSIAHLQLDYLIGFQKASLSKAVAHYQIASTVVVMQKIR